MAQKASFVSGEDFSELPTARLMPHHTKAHTFIGQAATRAIEGFAGFQIGQVYELRYRREDEGLVVTELDHLQGGGQLAVTAGEYELWFSK